VPKVIFYRVEVNETNIDVLCLVSQLLGNYSFSQVLNLTFFIVIFKAQAHHSHAWCDSVNKV